MSDFGVQGHKISQRVQTLKKRGFGRRQWWAFFGLIIVPMILVGISRQVTETATLYYAPKILFYGLTPVMLCVLAAFIVVNRMTSQPYQKSLVLLGGADAIHLIWYGFFAEGVGFAFSQSLLQDIDLVMRFVLGLGLLFIVVFDGRAALRSRIIFLALVSATLLPIGLIFAHYGYTLQLNDTHHYWLLGMTIISCAVAVFAYSDTCSVFIDKYKNISYVCYVIYPMQIALRLFPIWSLMWWGTFIFIAIVSLIVVCLILLIEFKNKSITLTYYFALTSFVIIISVIMMTSWLDSQHRDDLATEALIAQNHVDIMYMQQELAMKPAALGTIVTSIGDWEKAVVYQWDDALSFEQARQRDQLDTLAMMPDQMLENMLVGDTDIHIEECFADCFNAGNRLLAVAPIDASITQATDGKPRFLVVKKNLNELGEERRTARRTQLLFAAGATGFLFFTLLFIVNRADDLSIKQKQELEEAYSELQAAESWRDDMTNMIVHDLRQPLAAIRLGLDYVGQTIGRPEKSDKQKHYIRQATNATNGMMYLITDLLDVAQLEAGVIGLELTVLCPATLIEERAAAFADAALAGNKKLTTRWKPEIVAYGISADQRLLQRVLDNLISNALRYTAADDSVTITAEHVDDNIEFGICDTGMGIPKESLETIFDKYIQASENEENRRQGVGLGLSFCQLVIEAHGGKIWVESKHGEGSSFYFTIPTAATGCTATDIEKVTQPLHTVEPAPTVLTD